MTRPTRLGLGLHSGPETRVRTVVVGPRHSTLPTPAPPPAPAAAAPAARASKRSKTGPSDAAAPAKRKQKTKLVLSVKVKSPALKRALERSNLIKKK